MRKLEPIKDMAIGHGVDLAEAMRDSGGFVAKDVGRSVAILETMMKEKDCVTFLSFPSCIIATGLRGVIKDMVRHKLVDVIVTTCGTLDHDLARIWKPYCHGAFDDKDEDLLGEGIHRLGNILVPESSYGIILEEKLQPMFRKLYQIRKEYATHELIHEVGRMLESEKNRESSIVYWAYKNNIPIVVPGITDGAFGLQAWLFWQEHKDFRIDLMKDEQLLSDTVFDAKRTGALMIGGGISKHHTIWWNQFRDGLDYAVYITTANEWDGSLSGARMREAISWKKLKKEAEYVDVTCDATVALPVIYASLIRRMNL